MSFSRRSLSGLAALAASTLMLVGAASAQAAIDITSLDNVTYTNDPTFRPDVAFTGATPVEEDAVTLKFGPVDVGTINADTNGDGTIEATQDIAPVPAPNTTVQVSVTDEFNTNNTDAVSVNVDQMPALSGTLQGRLVQPSEVAFSVTSAIPDETVVLYDNGVEVGRGTADENGTVLSIAPSSSPANGSHAYRAATEDAANIESTKTAAVTVTVADEPTITVSSPADGSYINNPELRPNVTFTGASSGGQVEVFFGGVNVGTVNAELDGSGSVTPSGDIAPSRTANQSVSIQVRDNNAGFNQTITHVTVDNVPDLAGPGDDTTWAAENVVYDVTGAIPSNDVVLFSDGVEVAREQADIDGEVENLTPDAPLSAGEHTLTAVTVDDDDFASSPKTIDLTVTPAAPRLDGLFDFAQLNQSRPTIALTGVHTGATKVTLYEVILSDDADPDTYNSIAETAISGNSDGTETVRPDAPLTNGEHILIARQTVNNTETDDYQAGNAWTTVHVNTAAATLSSDDDGKLTEHIPYFDVEGALRGYNSDNTNTVELYIDGDLAGSDTADSEGNAGIRPETVAEGAHTAYVLTVDDLGHRSTVHSNEVTFTLDTVAPAPPTFLSPTNGSTVTTNLPQVSVRAEPGSRVVFIVDYAGEEGSVIADSNGNATFNVTQALAEGSHALSALAIDAAGNYDYNAAAYAEFTVKTAVAVPPTPPTPTPPTATPPVPTPVNPADPDSDGISNDWTIGGKAAPAPATPKVNVTGGKVKLRLAPAPKGAKSVRVYREDGKGGYKLVKTLKPGSKTFTDAKVKAGHTYKYKTVGVNAKGQQSKASGTATAKVKKQK